MITHLLNLYSTLLGLRRKKKGEVFRLLLLLLPPLPPLSLLDGLSRSVFLNVCHFHYAARISRFLSFIDSSGLISIGHFPLAALFALANKKRKEKGSDTFYASDSYNLFRNVVYRRSA